MSYLIQNMLKCTLFQSLIVVLYLLLLLPSLDFPCALMFRLGSPFVSQSIPTTSPETSYCSSSTSAGPPSWQLRLYQNKQCFKTFPTFDRTTTPRNSMHLTFIPHLNPALPLLKSQEGPHAVGHLQIVSPTFIWTSGSVSSNYSLTVCNFVKLLPLLLLKRLNTWICYFNWTAYRGCPEVLTGI